MVRKLPERMNAMMRKQAKKMSAVPKSRMRNRNARQMAANTMNSVIFFFVCKWSSVDAPTNTNAILMNSEGWKLNGPMKIQLREPLTSLPSTRFATNSKMAPMAM